VYQGILRYLFIFIISILKELIFYVSRCFTIVSTLRVRYNIHVRGQGIRHSAKYSVTKYGVHLQWKK